MPIGEGFKPADEGANNNETGGSKLLNVGLTVLLVVLSVFAYQTERSNSELRQQVLEFEAMGNQQWFCHNAERHSLVVSAYIDRGNGDVCIIHVGVAVDPQDTVGVDRILHALRPCTKSFGWAGFSEIDGSTTFALSDPDAAWEPAVRRINLGPSTEVGDVPDSYSKTDWEKLCV